MTRQYLIGELSVRLEQLQAAAPGSARDVADLRCQVETRPVTWLPAELARALAAGRPGVLGALAGSPRPSRSRPHPGRRPRLGIGASARPAHAASPGCSAASPRLAGDACPAESHQCPPQEQDLVLAYSRYDVSGLRISRPRLPASILLPPGPHVHRPSSGAAAPQPSPRSAAAPTSCPAGTVGGISANPGEPLRLVLTVSRVTASARATRALAE